MVIGGKAYERKIKPRYIIVIIMLLVLIGGICFYIDHFDKKRMTEVKERLKPDSAWKYENGEEDFEMELIIPNTANHIADNVLRYSFGDRSGEWRLSLLEEENGIEAGYVIDNAFYRVWQGKIEVDEEKIIINEIVTCEDFNVWIETGMISEQYSEDTVPEGIEIIELSRVK